MQTEITSFEGEKVARYLREAFGGFLRDNPDSDYQRGYLAALLAVYREGAGKTDMPDLIKLLERML